MNFLKNNIEKLSNGQAMAALGIYGTDVPEEIQESQGVLIYFFASIDLIFGHHLKSIARSLNFTYNERISLYIINNDRFICCARFSQNLGNNLLPLYILPIP